LIVQEFAVLHKHIVHQSHMLHMDMYHR